MKLNFGKHAGKSLQLLLLNEPAYIEWMLEENSASGPLRAARAEAERLIARFDAKPLLRNCSSQLLPPHRATRCTLYAESASGEYWWCATCDPYQAGASNGKLHIVSSYEGALRHVALRSGSKKDYRALVRAIAEAKGLPKRVGEAQAAAFFAETP